MAQEPTAPNGDAGEVAGPLEVADTTIPEPLLAEAFSQFHQGRLCYAGDMKCSDEMSIGG